MVNFRFHIVSLVAVFLALALGIGMGVTVIDKATVDLLQNRLNAVRDDVREANARSADLQAQIDQSGRFVDHAGDYLVNKRLDGTIVTFVRMAGIDSAAVDQLSQKVTEAGGFVRGSLSITERLNLAQNDDVDDLAAALGVSTSDPAQLRTTMTNRIAAVVSGNAPAASLSELENNGYISWSPGTNGGDLEVTSFAGGRMVVASGPSVAVSNDVGATAVVRAINAQGRQQVLAVDTGLARTAERGEVRATFVKPIIDDPALRTSVATVDNLEQEAGRIAAVLALGELGDAKVGHYGVGPGAASILPPLTN